MSSADEKQQLALEAVDPTRAAAAREALRRYSIHIIANPKGMTRDDSIALQVLANLLPRVFKRVTFDGSQSALQLPESFLPRIHTERPAACDLVIQLGAETPEYGAALAPRRLYVSARGWTSYLSTEVPCSFPPSPPNGIAAVYAAALAVGDAFNDALHDYFARAEPLTGTHLFDLATLSTVTSPNHEPDISQGLHLNEATLVGVGAVGQAFVMCLLHLPGLAGLLRLVDHDFSDEGNEQRCVLAFPENRHNPKVFLARARLQATHPFLHIDAPVGIHPLFGDWALYRQLTHGAITDEIVVTTIDNEQGRRDVQASIPRVILNGWTETAHDQLAYGIGRHTLLGERACLSCFHKPPENAPSEVEFAASRTGLGLAECERRLSDPSILTTTDEIEGVAERWDVPPERLYPFVNKPLIELVHGNCGLGGMDIDGNPVVASVTHVPTLVGALLAAQFVLEALTDVGAKKLDNLASFDALTLPTAHHVHARGKKDGCICKDPVYRDVAAKQWPTE